MWLMLAGTLALGAELVVEAHVPAEIHLDGLPMATLYRAGTIRLEMSEGRLPLTIFVNGQPERVDVDVPASGSATVVIGRTGITTGPVVPIEVLAAPGTAKVEFRVAGGAPVMLQLDDTRHKLIPGQTLSVDLTNGPHRVWLRDHSGTIIWARGTLEVAAATDFVVQLAEGRVPEIAGKGGSWHPEGR